MVLFNRRLCLTGLVVAGIVNALPQNLGHISNIVPRTFEALETRSEYVPIA